ncbi:MAG TPA: LysR family transcriptional regulator [Micropruina sp.]|nr:LysR family transcriptional regulator [Micropruina sp.]HMR22341.1 LysR family transcriptional regulator [Micropruina sp.]
MSAGLSDASWSTLRVFVAVYRAGSITAAAADLGMAQASVSAQIATLEKRLGYQLFQRVRTGVIATDRGRDLAALLAGPVDALAAVTGAASGGDHPGERSMVIGGPAEFLSEVVLPGLVTELPVGVRLDARFGLADPLIEALETGQLDVLVSSVQPRRRGLRFAPVYDEHFVVVAHPRWADQARHDIDSVPVLAYDAQLQIIRRYWRSVFDRRPTRLRAVALVPDLRVLARLAVAGVGMTVLPEYLARSFLERGDLVRLHEPDVAPLNTLYVATRRAGPVPDPILDAIRLRIVALCRAA